jgi:hypothetical protein
MVDLNGHEAGNRGHSQGKPKAYRDSSTRRDVSVIAFHEKAGRCQEHHLRGNVSSECVKGNHHLCRQVADVPPSSILGTLVIICTVLACSPSSPSSSANLTLAPVFSLLNPRFSTAFLWK